MFSIVRFKDGLDIVPSIWLNNDKTISKWPPFSLKDSNKIVKAIQKSSVPTDQWYDYSVLEVIKMADTYEDAHEKLKYIDEISDVSDMDKMKRTWHQRLKARHKYFENSEDDSDNEQSQPAKRTKCNIPYPSPPTLLSKFGTSETTKSKSRIIGNKKVEFPIRSVNKAEKKESSTALVEKQDLLHFDENEDNEADISKNQNKPLSPSHNPSNLSSICISENESTSEVLQQSKITAKSSTKSCYATTTSKINHDTYIIGLQKKILRKINNLEFQNKTIITRLTTIENCSNTKTPESQLLQLKEELLNLFPIKTVEDLTNLERRLNKKSFFDQVVQFFTRKGGYNCHNLIWNILNSCFANSVAVQFSYKGQKGKQKFNSTKLNTCIHKAAQLNYLNITDAEIISSISKWLDSSKTRLLKENRIRSSVNSLNVQFNNESDNEIDNPTDNPM